MRPSTLLSMLIAASSQAVAQASTSSAATPSSSVTADGPYTGKLGNATIVRNNPPGVVYRATFPKDPFFKSAYPDGGNIEGSVIATANPNGVGVIFSINWHNLPKAGGPFMYHLHVDPVPENGNCTATLAHLDPFDRPETPLCDAALPETCQVGDLSGKFGDIPEGTETFQTQYVDLYATTLEGLGAFFGNRSIVFHYANKTRVSCASFEKVADGTLLEPTGGSCTGDSKPSGTVGLNTSVTAPKPTGSTNPPTVTTAAGASLKAGAAGVVAFAAAVAFLL